jgi:uncharacterized protein
VSDRLVLFGATGATGSHVLSMALDAGLNIRAYVRSPDKVPAELSGLDNCEVVEGTFADSDKIQAAIEGATMVVCTAGNAAASKESLIMLALVKDIVAGMRTHGAKRFLYQAGAFSPEPGTENSFMVKMLMRPVLGTMMGITGMLRDNDAVMAYLKDEAKDIDWTVTRPGQLKEQPSKGALKPIDSLSGTAHFCDLATFTLNTVQSGAYVREFPYVGY